MKKAASINYSKKALAALKILKKTKNSVFVVDDNQPLGLITMTDVKRYAMHKSIDTATVLDIMNANIIALPPLAAVNVAKHALESLDISVIPIVKGGKLKGIFTEEKLLDFYEKGSIFGKQDELFNTENINTIVEDFTRYATKLNNKQPLSEGEVCDLLTYQDFLKVANNLAPREKPMSALLKMSYFLITYHLGIKYKIEKKDIDGVLDHIITKGCLSETPRYDKDFIAYQRIVDKALGPMRKEDFKINLHSILSQ